MREREGGGQGAGGGDLCEGRAKRAGCPAVRKRGAFCGHGMSGGMAVAADGTAAMPALACSRLLPGSAPTLRQPCQAQALAPANTTAPSRLTWNLRSRTREEKQSITSAQLSRATCSLAAAAAFWRCPPRSAAPGAGPSSAARAPAAEAKSPCVSACMKCDARPVNRGTSRHSRATAEQGYERVQ